MIPPLPTPPADLGGAPCRTKTRLFFPVDGERADQRHSRVEAAKAICGACPHQHACAEYARTNDMWADWTGIWGGLTPFERRTIRRAAERSARLLETARCGTESGYARHRRNNQQPCDLCRQAHNRYGAYRARTRRKEAAA